MSNLHDKALLVSLSISQWAGRRLDKAATASAEAAHATKGRVGNYNKQLLPDCYELERIHSLTADLRKFFLAQTLPWMTDGTRIISAQNYLDFTQALRARKTEHERAVEAFLTAYPNLVRIAQVKLGNLFNEAEYPSVSKLREAFAINCNFYPMPAVSDFRISLGADAQAEFTKNIKSAEREAMREVWSRLHSVVSKAAETLAKPDAVFRDTLLSNMTELCSLLPKLNITDDPELENMRTEVERSIATQTAERLRENADERKGTAEALADIMRKMSGVMSTGGDL